MMRKKNLWMLATLLLCCLSFTACIYEMMDNAVEPGTDTPTEDLADYTVMLYTCGGSNLDNAIEADIIKAAKAIKADSKKVRYMVQYKYSREDNISKNLTVFTPSGIAGHLYRFEATPAKLKKLEKNEKINLTNADIYGTQNEKAELFQPDSIANFLKYCQKVAPAKNYILVLSDHGGGYTVYEDYDKSLQAKTRGVVMDDNVDLQSISCKELRAGIEQSGMHLTLLNFDCCLMNNMEVLSEFVNLADYVLASGHTIAGEDHKAFIELLYEAAEKDNFVEAMTKFAKANAEYNHKIYENNKLRTWARNVDFVLTDMKKFPAVLTTLKEFTDFIIKDYKADYADEYQFAAAGCYQYTPNLPLYDLRNYCEQVDQYIHHVKLDGEWVYIDNLIDAIEAAQLAHTYAISSEGYEEGSFNLSYSVSVGGKGFIGASRTKDAPNIIKGYTKDGKYAELNMETLKLEAKGVAANHLTWANTYNRLEFDIATGWSTWLEKNPGFPVNNPPYDNRDDMLPTGMPQSAADWENSIMAIYNASYKSIKNFKFTNSFSIEGKETAKFGLMNSQFSWSQGGLPAPVKGQFIVEITPRPGKTGPWELILEKIEFRPLIRYKGKDIPAKSFTLPNINLSGTSIETEGADAAKKAYINMVFFIDKDGNVTYNSYKKDDNFILK